MSIFVDIIENKGTITADNLSITGGASAANWTFANDLLGSGVLVTEDGQGFTVAEQSPAAAAVDVSPGVAYVPDTAFTSTGTRQRLYRVRADATEAVTISANASGSTRYDWIVIDVDTSATSNDDASNIATVTKVEGTGGAGLPSLANDQIPLALVTATNGFSTITDSDITDVREFIGGQGSGWNAVTHTWVYVSASAPSFVAEVASNTDAANFYYEGMKIRAYQLTGGWKYFEVTGVTTSGGDTEITLFGGDDYVLENESILFVQVSNEQQPKGWTNDVTKYSVTARGYTTGSTALVAGVEKDIVFNAESYDYSDNFNTSTGVYTARVAGPYAIKSVGIFAINSSGDKVFLRIYKNAAQIASGAIDVSAAGDAPVNVSTDIDLAIGDTIKVTAENVNNNDTLYGGEGVTSVSIHLIKS